MSDEKAKSIEDIELPSLEEMGFDSADDDGGSIEEQERKSLAQQDELQPTEDPTQEKEEEESTEDENVPEYTETEQKAMKMGWTPKDDYKGDPDTWKSATTFIEHGDLMGKIGASNRKTSQLQKAIDSMANLIKKQSEKLDAKDRQELMEARRAAIADSDIEKVEAYDKRIKEIENPQTSHEAPQEAQDFAFENSDWFDGETPDTAGMRAFAIKYEEGLARKFPNVSISQRLAKTKEVVVNRYPTYFGKKPVEAVHKPNHARVERSTTQKTTKKEITVDDLPEKAKKMVKNMWRASNKKISMENYIKELIRTGAIEV